MQMLKSEGITTITATVVIAIESTEAAATETALPVNRARATTKSRNLRISPSRARILECRGWYSLAPRPLYRRHSYAGGCSRGFGVEGAETAG
jgi:hypothetical protein